MAKPKRTVEDIEQEISLLEGHITELTNRVHRLSALIADAAAEVERIRRRLPALKAWRTMKRKEVK